MTASVTETAFFGGSAHLTISTTPYIDLLDPRGGVRIYHLTNDGASGRVVRFVDARLLVCGYPLATIWRETPDAYTIVVQDYDGNPIAVTEIGGHSARIYEFSLLDNTTSAGGWHVREYP